MPNPSRVRRRRDHRILQFETLEARHMLSASPIGGEQLVNDDFVSGSQSTHLVASAVSSHQDGSFNVVYNGRGPIDRSGVFYRRVDSAGNEQGSSTRVNETTRGRQDSGSVVTAADGSFVVTWAGRGKGDSRGVFARRFDADGQALGGEFRVNQTRWGKQQTPVVASLSDGGFVVAWQGVGSGDRSGIFYRSYDADGNVLSGEIRANSYRRSWQVRPAIAADPNGGFAIAWDGRGPGDGRGIFVKRFDADGDPIGAEQRANTTRHFMQRNPALDIDGNGKLTVAWSGYGAGDFAGVFARQFNEQMSPIGTELRVNTTTARYQADPSVAATSDGRLVVTWSSYRQDGSRWGVFGQQFDANGQPDGEEFQVNTTTRGTQRRSTVAMDARGDFVVAWSGRGEGDYRGVFTRRFGTPTVDVTPPEIVAALSHDTGVNSNDGLTLNATITGRVSDDDSGVAQLRVRVDGATPVSVAVDAAGDFVFDPELPDDGSADGLHTATFAATDQQGNTNTIDVTFTLDTLAPAAPVGLALTEATDTGGSVADGITRNDSPTVHGDAEEGSVVTLIVDGFAVGQTTANSPWQLPTGPLDEGQRAVTATAADAAGNQSGASLPLTIVIDTTPPIAPTLTLAPESDTAPTGDLETTNAIVSLVGQTEAQITVELVENGQQVNSDAGGLFEFAGVSLALGANTFTAQATDLAGNQITSAPVTFTRIDDTTEPPNEAPIFDIVGPLSVMPGGVLNVALKATDPEGEPITFGIRSDRPLPTGKLAANGTLTLRPTTQEIGVYNLTLIADDGAMQATQSVTLTVEADPVTTTRLSGSVLNTLLEPLVGVRVAVAGVEAFTGKDGSFTIDFGNNPFPGDTLIIHGEEVTGSATYPFIAEKLPLVLGRTAIDGVNNFIDRPIFLPALDVEGGTKIDPNQNTTVRQEIAPGEFASVFVSAGSLQTDDGAGGTTPFTGVLSITEVPAERTPAALPPNLLPDVVVTIQPGEMIFTDPAELTLPNRAGYAPGTIMDLWSINPITGVFDQVGQAQVSVDGSVIETISGGIRNSSWHFVAPPPPVAQQVSDKPTNQDQCGCGNGNGEATQESNSQVELHSGALREQHTLAAYQSLGAARSVTLHYNSERADARPIIHFGFDNVVDQPELLLAASLSFSRGNFSKQSAGFTGAGLTDGGFHFWDLPAAGGNLEAALQSDLRDQESGVYSYTVRQGLLQQVTDQFNGTLSESTGQIVHVNAIDSAFGAGWQLGGVQQLVENPDGSVLFIDGNGANFVFDPPSAAGEPFVSPVGDFSMLGKNGDGSFTRTGKDQSTAQFDTVGRLVSMTDRNGNQTQHIYQNDRLTKIVDPVGLETVFAYNAQGRVSSITDPAGRVTALIYDANGNLTRITDPDASSRNFEYDANHHLTAETDQLGTREQTNYGFHGRVAGSIRKDGSTQAFDPLQTRVLHTQALTADPSTAPVATAVPSEFVAISTDANGNETRTVLDQRGQAVSAKDDEGSLPTVGRNDENLVTIQTDARGFVTDFTYDDRGNVTRQSDEAVRRASVNRPVFPGYKFSSSGVGHLSIATSDFNQDGTIDLVSANLNSSDVSVFLGNGDGTFQDDTRFSVNGLPSDIAIGDFDGDGLTDLATTNIISQNGSILLGNGDGTFQASQDFSSGIISYSLAVGDVNGDGLSDIATLNPLDDEVAVSLSRGTGIFDPPQFYSLGGTPHAVAMGDLNGDGLADLITTNSASLSVLFANSDGSLQPEQRLTLGDTPSALSLGDFDDDGIVDLAVTDGSSNDVWVLLNNGDGSFQNEQRFSVGPWPGSIESDDFNGDGFTDLVTANLDTSDVSLLLGNGDGTFQPERRFAGRRSLDALTSSDFDGDGLADLALVTLQSADIEILLGAKEDGIVSQQRALVGNFPYSVAIEDLNGDGVADIVSGNRGSDDVSVLLGIAEGGFLAEQRFAVGDRPEGVATSDFNNDGLTDVVTSNVASNDVTVLLGNGDGTFQSPRSSETGDGPVSLSVGDFNNDGLSDLATTNANSNDVTVLLGGGDGTFQPPQRVASGSGPRSVISGDFNQDNLTDLAIANQNTDDLSVMLGNGDGTFQSQQRFDVGDQPGVVVTADFNGDGLADLATSNIGSGNVTVLLGSGNGTFQAIGNFATSPGAQTVATGEFNGDGIIDLVTANIHSHDASVLLGNGGGTFQFAQNFSAGTSPYFAVTGDVNGDGLTDIVTANSGSDDISILLNNGGDPEIASVQPRSFTYDPTFNQLVSVTDELGRQTLFDIDSTNGNRLSATEVVGEIDAPENGEADDLLTTFSYTAQGLVDLVTDPLGRVTDFDYNARGLLSQVTFAVGTADEAFQTFEYDTAGNQTVVMDENGNRTEFEYDAVNRLAKITEADPDGAGPLAAPVTTLNYDARGNLTQTTDAAGSTVVNTYDVLDRLTFVRDDLDNVSSFSYDAVGNLLVATDPNGNDTQNEYDARNRIFQSTDPDGGVTLFEYDDNNNLIGLTDPVGNLTQFVYDARNRLVEEIDPLGSSTFYAYDAADNLVRKVDRNGRITRFAYDDVDRLITETWLAADGVTVENTINYSYDKAGNLLNVDDLFSELTFTYDARDRVDTVDNAGTPNAPNVVLDYEYDGVGNVLGVTDTIDGVAGATTEYDYDALNRTTNIQQSGNNVSAKLVDLVFNELGQFDEIARYSDLGRNNLVALSDYEYDKLNRLTDLDHTNAIDQVFAFYDFEYDPSSRIIRITDVHGATDYSYDDRDQLIGADRDATDLRGDENYTFDANGNRTDSHLHGSGYVTGDGNRLLSDGTFDYEYDAEGNMAKRTEIATGDYREFDWDHRNRLIRVTDFSSGGVITQEVQYAYDALDRRIEKTVDDDGASSGGEVSTIFVYDREDVLLDFVDADGSGATQQAILDLRYLHGPGIDQVLAQENGSTQWLLTDHLRTVRDVIGNGGNLLNHIKYDSFGNILNQTDSAVVTRYLFTGRELDFEAGLQYNRARYFDANMGRFISEDPIGFAGADTNLMRYVGNAATIFRDPDGLEKSQVVIQRQDYEPSLFEIATGLLTPWYTALLDPAFTIAGMYLGELLGEYMKEQRENRLPVSEIPSGPSNADRTECSPPRAISGYDEILKLGGAMNSPPPLRSSVPSALVPPRKPLVRPLPKQSLF